MRTAGLLIVCKTPPKALDEKSSPLIVARRIIDFIESEFPRQDGSRQPDDIASRYS
jgi:hypothetical protein